MCPNLDIMSSDDAFYTYFITYKLIKMHMFLGQALVNTTSNNTATQRHGQVGRPSV